MLTTDISRHFSAGFVAEEEEEEEAEEEEEEEEDLEEVDFTELSTSDMGSNPNSALCSSI